MRVRVYIMHAMYMHTCMYITRVCTCHDLYMYSSYPVSVVQEKGVLWVKLKVTSKLLSFTYLLQHQKGGTVHVHMYMYMHTY